MYFTSLGKATIHTLKLTISTPNKYRIIPENSNATFLQRYYISFLFSKKLYVTSNAIFISLHVLPPGKGERSLNKNILRLVCQEWLTLWMCRVNVAFSILLEESTIEITLWVFLKLSKDTFSNILYYRTFL